MRWDVVQQVHVVEDQLTVLNLNYEGVSFAGNLSTELQNVNSMYAIACADFHPNQISSMIKFFFLFLETHFCS